MSLGRNDFFLPTAVQHFAHEHLRNEIENRASKISSSFPEGAATPPSLGIGTMPTVAEAAAALVAAKMFRPISESKKVITATGQAQ